MAKAAWLFDGYLSFAIGPGCFFRGSCKFNQRFRRYEMFNGGEDEDVRDDAGQEDARDAYAGKRAAS